MAAEGTVCDVLCEAMDYLTKLGSNLRTRSENLKQKRIRKDRLRNAHAVNKAAKKALILCELSKKSLDIVETGVRKVLAIVDASQTTSDIGGKLNVGNKYESKKKFYKFEFESHTLRISKKISVQHYMSVRVLAKDMSASMQEKYPVFYDCKLKETRAMTKNTKIKSSISNSDMNQDTYSEKQHENVVSNDSESFNMDQASRKICVESKLTEIDSNGRIAELEVPNLDAQDEVIGTNEKSCTIPYDGLEATDESSQCDKKTSVDNLEEEDNLSKGSLTKASKKSVDQIKTNDENQGKEVKENTGVSKKLGKNKIIDDSSDSNEEPLRKQKTVESRKNGVSSSGEDNESKSSNKTHNSGSKFKKIRLIDTDDDSSSKKDSDNDVTRSNNSDNNKKSLDEDSKPLIRCVNITKLLKPDILDSKISKLTNVKRKNLAMCKIKSIGKQRTLSKDDVARRIKNNNAMKVNNEEFWVEKRKEVKQFKPKQFTVKVECLPYLSTNFLLTNNLKKIIQGGKIICEVTNEKDKGLEHSNKNIDEVKNALLNDSDSDKEEQSKTIKNSDKSNAGISTDHASIKDALLNDSDSDINENIGQDKTKNVEQNKRNVETKIPKQIQNELKGKTEIIKSALLNDSDSDKNENINNIEQTPTLPGTINNDAKHIEPNRSNEEGNDKLQINEKDKVCDVKNTLLYDSDSDKEQSKTINNSDKSNGEISTDHAAIKDALLNDTDSERDEDIDQHKTMNSDIETNVPYQVETELKGETEIIKSVLLNDSDSDKNQNIKNIEQTPTLPGIISADDKHIEPNRRNEEDNVDKLQINEKDKVCDVQSDANNQSETIQDTEKNNSSLLDNSSDRSELSTAKKKKKKFKTKHAMKCMQAKKMLLRYSSSSENEQECSQKLDEDTKKPKSRKGRIKSYTSSSSLSNDETMKSKNKSSQDSSSPIKKKAKIGHSDNEDKDARSIDQVDGTIDEDSNSGASKMVRSKAKPSGNSGQNSDNQDPSDKDIDGLTNLKTLNKTHRRRGSTSPKHTNTENKSSAKRISRSKPTPMIGEDLLHAESSSEASDDDHMHAHEDLPSVTIPGLNGDGISHLAKDDLLGDSDSSVSHEKDQSEDTQNQDDSEEEENVKLKRRNAANLISSDSEGGTSRRKQKDADARISDFEDSEDESSEAGKRSKRKKKASESDGSAGSSSDGGKKKRRRIKQLKDSDASGSDTENEGKNKHGRKNIRKVMGKSQLEEATKKAAREEKERIARITERQKLYNNLEFDESGKPDEVVLEKVVLDFDPETKEPLIEVDRGLVKKLKPHQANGIKFMWDACFESAKRIKKDRGSGCILAHCMGLGKTLQVISLTHTLLIHGSLTGVNRVLVVCPLSTVLNWVSEFRMWLKHADSEFEVDVYELSRYKQNSERAFQLNQWFEGGGVCVLGYEMYRNLSADNNKKFKKKMLRSFQESLVDPGPDLVVCDEGHLLKNEKTSLSQSMNRVRTRRRIVLTGTPLQNNLKEYYCMVQFVKPNLLGKYNEYLNRFVNPITNGQYTDSTEYDIKVMKRRSHVLHKMLDGAVQRRDYGVLAPFLPPKHEYVLFITLSDVQVKLYQFYLDNYSRRPLPGKSSGFLFPDFQSLQRIWTHPLVLKYNSERYEIMQQKKREREEEDSEGSLVDFIDDDSTPDETSTEESSDDSSDLSDDSRKKSKKKKSGKKSKSKESKAGQRRGTRANPIDADGDEADPEVAEVIEVKNENPTEWWIKLVEDEELDDMRNSHKLVLLFDILRQCETIGDKLLVFSQSLYSLDLIEHFLGKVDEATQEGRIDEKLGNHVGSWSPGVDYFRLDGSTSCENRSIWCKNFNREDNPRARLFLISTRAGGLGINLVAANRVVIFDVSWNPSHDVQSIFRVYRFGQKKPCYVYRFLAMGTMEEKIYERQVTKQAISKRVIDEQQIDRHYAENDLAELYKFDARPEEPRPLPTLPKDRLFAEMLREHEAQIYKYHEHDSLLENKEEETLSEEERKAAWEDFENEKNKPPPAPFPSAWPMHNGMVPGLLAQQQQQLAYAALAAMVRKDMPNVNDNQIRDMLPLIFNSNPGLMQKMSEIYKYAPQPGMMNPGMMNPVMNPAASGVAGAAGMGGTSGLQYEPPWQRQHQQQQQMRLQQLLQQNQQMGAKFYAGGLGSRDPVAMALQQQRAREIMMAGGAGRPRGRPPLAPRPPAPQHAHDVVNLDSD